MLQILQIHYIADKNAAKRKETNRQLYLVTIISLHLALKRQWKIGNYVNQLQIDYNLFPCNAPIIFAHQQAASKQLNICI